MGGQPSYAAFRNTMESIFHLVDAVKRIPWADCGDLVKIFSGCNQYVYDRLTRCGHAGTITAAQLDAIRATVKPADLL